MQHTRHWGAGLCAALLLITFAPPSARAGLILSRMTDCSNPDNLLFGRPAGSPAVAEVSWASQVLSSSAGAATLTSNGTSLSWLVYNRGSLGAPGALATLTVRTNQGVITFDSPAGSVLTPGDGYSLFTLTADGGTAFSEVTLTVRLPGAAPAGAPFGPLGPLGGGSGETGMPLLTQSNPAPPGALLALAGLGSLGGAAALGWARRRLARK